MKQHEVKAGFEKWSVFEKAKKANRMCHAEAYQGLREILTEKCTPCPRILDIGCGDADDISLILKDLPVSEYIGIDNSPQVLGQARSHLYQRVSCTWQLICADYTEALHSIEPPLDVIWLGLFLHHLPQEQKRAFFQQAFTLLSPAGAVICHDPVLLETENRAGFLERISHACRNWQELTPDEKEMLCRHWSDHGRQEHIRMLEEIAGESGFSQTQILWRDPDVFYALLAFRR